MLNSIKTVMWAAAFIGLLLAVDSPASAKIILKEKVTYYKVSGKTGKQIFKSMLDNGPKIGRRNEHALATTEFDYDVTNLDVGIKNGRCIFNNLDVVVRVKYLYPSWRGNGSASKATRAAWKTFEKSVIWHEGQHVKIAMEYAKEYEKVLKKMKLRVSDDCSKANALSKFGAVRAALKHNRKQRRFDRRDLRRGGRGYEAQLQLLKAK
ncbi:MAG: DUF922 domain-containing protein [Rhizobiaceae bacterium]|nr:DUF922 domain-containing protein [Rhizobiaceae bacterium]